MSGKRGKAHRGLRDDFAADLPVEKVRKLADLAPMIELYRHRVRAGDFEGALMLFRDRLGRASYFQFGAYELNIELLSALFPDGEDHPPRLESEADQGWVLTRLANALSLSGRPRRAVPLFERAIRLDEELDDKLGVAVDLGNLAHMAQVPIGALRSAEANLYRKIELCRELDERFHEATTHLELGRLLTYRGRWEEAESEIETALGAFEGEPIQALGIGSAYRSLLDLLRIRTAGTSAPSDRRVDALAAARRALERADEFARTDHPVERDFVRAHWLLGAALRENGELGGAKKHLREALERCRRIGLVEFEAGLLIDLGRLWEVQGDSKKARRWGVEAVEIAARCGHVMQEADAHLLLARLDQAAGDLAGARDHAARARELAACDGPPDYTYKVAYEEAGALLAALG